MSCETKAVRRLFPGIPLSSCGDATPGVSGCRGFLVFPVGQTAVGDVPRPGPARRLIRKTLPTAVLQKQTAARSRRTVVRGSGTTVRRREPVVRRREATARRLRTAVRRFGAAVREAGPLPGDGGQSSGVPGGRSEVASRLSGTGNRRTFWLRRTVFQPEAPAGTAGGVATRHPESDFNGIVPPEPVARFGVESQTRRDTLGGGGRAANAASGVPPGRHFRNFTCGENGVVIGA